MSKEEPNRLMRISFLFLSLIVISFFLKFASEFTHEVLGHCGFGMLMGGTVNGWYVSWIWPLEFGYASVSFGAGIPGSSTFARAVMMIGGIAACLIAASVSHSLIYVTSKKRILPKGSISKSKLLILHVAFWYGFWAFANSVGYLILGGVTNFGDIGMFVGLTGTPNWLIITLGFIAFFILLYLISFNSSIIFRPLLPKTSPKMITSIFWLILPLIFFLILLNPDMPVPIWMIPVGFAAMLIPTVLMLFIGNRFPNNIQLNMSKNH